MATTQLRAQQIKLGNGLTADGSNAVAVLLGTNPGLSFTTGAVGILLDTNPGLQLGAGGLSVKVAAAGGITSGAGGLTLPLTTKGDLLAFTTTTTRLAVGTDTFVLTADSSSAEGFKWAAASGGSSSYVANETPSGTFNGSNVTFTLANTPVSGTVILALNGVVQKPGGSNDYTISGTTITYLTAPISGDTLLASYFM